MLNTWPKLILLAGLVFSAILLLSPQPAEARWPLSTFRSCRSMKTAKSPIQIEEEALYKSSSDLDRLFRTAVIRLNATLW